MACNNGHDGGCISGDDGFSNGRPNGGVACGDGVIAMAPMALLMMVFERNWSVWFSSITRGNVRPNLFGRNVASGSLARR